MLFVYKKSNLKKIELVIRKSNCTVLPKSFSIPLILHLILPMKSLYGPPGALRIRCEKPLFITLQ